MKQNQTYQLSAAEDIIRDLPPPDYKQNFQPSYPDENLLLSAVRGLQEIDPVTTSNNINHLLGNLAVISEKEDSGIFVITGNCHESVTSSTSIRDRFYSAIISHAIVLGCIPDALHIYRGMGQNVKPRSNEFEILSDGTQVVSHQGDGVNGFELNQRTPDPFRMIDAAKQAHDLENAVTEYMNRHLPSAHEALLLPYEQAFIYVDPSTVKRYLLSTDMPWIGYRTNDPNGEQVKLLSGIENPVAGKIGSDSTPEQIALLHQKLNPEAKPGKLTFMLRFNQISDTERRILEAIKERAPGSLLGYDIHGVTRTNSRGQKIRSTSEIIDQIGSLAETCGQAGLRLHGVHLETTTELDRHECVDLPDQTPTHKGNIDPQLNLLQTQIVLKAAGQMLCHDTSKEQVWLCR